MIKKESRYYKYIDEKGKERFKKVTYTLYFSNNSLVDVRNEYNHSVEKESECWSFFKNKYS